MDNKLIWRDQVFCTAEKAAEKVAYPTKLIANISVPGLSEDVFCSQPVLMYGAGVWADNFIKGIIRYGSLKFIVTLRAVCVPPTVQSLDWLLEPISFKLLAGERKKIYQRSKEHSHTYRQLQHENKTLGWLNLRDSSKSQPWLSLRWIVT